MTQVMPRPTIGKDTAIGKLIQRALTAMDVVGLNWFFGAVLCGLVVLGRWLACTAALRAACLGTNPSLAASLISLETYKKPSKIRRFRNAGQLAHDANRCKQRKIVA